MTNNTIGFIGAGNMAQAIIGGLVSSGTQGKDIIIYDPNAEVVGAVCAQYGVIAAANNDDLVSQADVVVLAVKPQVMADVVKPLAGEHANNKLWVSIAAGIPIGLLHGWLGVEAPVVRVMPNTPALVSAGASGLFASKSVSTKQRGLAESILRAVGVAVWVEKESLIDSVTAISGSGPAYFFLMIEALEAAALEQGLEGKDARLLAIETAFGAAKLALESDIEPAELRRRVTSPGGTTEAALNRFERGGYRELVSSAVQSAADRAVELAEMAKGVKS